MTLRVRPARPQDKAAVVDLLHRRMNAKIPPERWALLFDYPWRPADAPDCGRILEAGGRVAGYLGATYVDRRIAGQRHRICNMSSWYLLPEHRGQGHGRAMVLDLTRDPELTYTDFTATAQVEAMLLAHAGFAVLDRERWLVQRGSSSGAAGVEDLAEAAGEIRAVLAHHAGLRDLRAVRVTVAAEQCQMLVQMKKKGPGILYHQLLHCDRPEVLARHAAAIAAALLPESPAVLAIDRRLLPAAPEGASCEPIPQPRLFKSRLAPGEIDNLYNEVLLLDQKLP